MFNDNINFVKQINIMQPNEAEYSITDLEHLTKIKAHTIRMWEKRYNILQPARTDSNIRIYNQEDLQRLLNITLLHNHGYKISKISRMSNNEILTLIQETTSEKSVKHLAVSAFKFAMSNFDQIHFHETYDQLLSEKTFREISYEVFIPLLDQVRVLQQTNTITPAHEYFITNLIKQKLILNIEKVSKNIKKTNNKVFVLFSPIYEVNNLGLLYLNFELLNKGYRTVYLGENISVEELLDFEKYYSEIIYFPYFTVFPEMEIINDYIQNLNQKIIDKKSEIWISGKMIEHIYSGQSNNRIKRFLDIKEVISNL